MTRRQRALWRLLVMRAKQLLCGHGMGLSFQYDGLEPGAEGLLVRTRCLRCGRVRYSAQQVSKSLR